MATPKTEAVLAWLAAHPGPYTARQIAPELGLTTTQTAWVLKHLAETGRIKRTRLKPNGPGASVYEAHHTTRRSTA